MPPSYKLAKQLMDIQSKRGLKIACYACRALWDILPEYRDQIRHAANLAFGRSCKYKEQLKNEK